MAWHLAMGSAAVRSRSSTSSSIQHPAPSILAGPRGRITVARAGLGAQGASPMRGPPALSPTLQLRRLAGILVCAHARLAGNPRLETNRASSPASGARPRPHRTARARYQRPQTCPQVRAAGPSRQSCQSCPNSPSLYLASAPLPSPLHSPALHASPQEPQAHLISCMCMSSMHARAHTDLALAAST